MLDAFSRVVDQADRKGAYLSDDEINGLSAMVADNNKRLDTVNRLTSNVSAITANAYRALVAEQPQIFGTGGACFHNRNQAACIRDLGFILRYVTYSVLAGDASVMDDRCLNGLRETYQALGTPGSAVVAVRRSRQVYSVPYDQLSSKFQEIHKRGGKIVSVTPT